MSVKIFFENIPEDKVEFFSMRNGVRMAMLYEKDEEEDAIRRNKYGRPYMYAFWRDKKRVVRLDTGAPGFCFDSIVDCDTVEFVPKNNTNTCVLPYTYSVAVSGVRSLAMLYLGLFIGCVWALLNRYAHAILDYYLNPYRMIAYENPHEMLVYVIVACLFIGSQIVFIVTVGTVFTWEAADMLLIKCRAQQPKVQRSELSPLLSKGETV